MLDLIPPILLLPGTTYVTWLHWDDERTTQSARDGFQFCASLAVISAVFLIFRLASIVIDKWWRMKSCWREHAQMSAEAWHASASRVREPRRRGERLRAADGSAEAANPPGPDLLPDTPVIGTGDDYDPTACVVCSANVKCVMVNDCAHVCMCNACARRVMDRDARCPICRGAITAGGTRRVFWL